METYFYFTEAPTAAVDLNEKLEKLRNILRLVKKSGCRIIYVAMYSLDCRNLLALAYEEDMLEGYAYLGTEMDIPLGKSVSNTPFTPVPQMLLDHFLGSLRVFAFVNEIAQNLSTRLCRDGARPFRILGGIVHLAPPTIEI